MKKIFPFATTTFFCLGINAVHSTEPARPTASSSNIPTISRQELEEKAKKPHFYIRHGKDPNPFYGAVYKLYDTCIYFGRDRLWKPVYKKISEHAKDNPNFSRVLLVLYNHKKKYKDQFVIVGIYGDSAARKKFLRKMQTFFGYSCAQATWCPEQNAFILSAIDIVRDPKEGRAIDIAFDPEIGKKFEQWLKTNK